MYLFRSVSARNTATKAIQQLLDALYYAPGAVSDEEAEREMIMAVHAFVDNVCAAAVLEAEERVEAMLTRGHE